jgi:DNA adenine methylase
MVKEQNALLLNMTIKSLKAYKTPLRYPGGKSRACTKMDQYFPDLSNYVEFREPFLGGGSVALHISKKYPHLKITVNDLYEPLVNFWVQLQQFGDELTEKLVDYKNNHPDPPKELRKVEGTEFPALELFLNAKEAINKSGVDSIERAAAFYIVNKCSFSGLTESSSFSKQASVSNFSMRGIEKLPGYSDIISNWHINGYSYEYLMERDVHKDIFMYLDPPYDIKDNLYGKKGDMHKGFDHDKFAEDCDKYKIDMMISYNSDQLVKDRFKNWQAAEFDLTYTMRSVGEYMREQKRRKELLLMNYNKPKVQPTFEGCYNYNRLKKEGLAE